MNAVAKTKKLGQLKISSRDIAELTEKCHDNVKCTTRQELDEVKQFSNQIAWHYTIGLNFPKIIHSGVIELSTKGVLSTESPIVWFSVNKMMDRTSCEASIKRADGSIIRARNVKEHRILGFGLYRIGMASSELLTYHELLKKAKIGYVRRKRLESVAKQLDVMPHEWRGSLSPIPITNESLLEYLLLLFCILDQSYS